MGYITAKEVAAKGFHTVLACRDELRGKEAEAALQRDNPAGSFEFRQLDLADLASVSDFCKATLDAGKGIDLLVNNAGVMATPEMETKDGFEFQLGVNHLGHFALTGQLYPLLSEADRCALLSGKRCVLSYKRVCRKARMCIIASAAHLWANLKLTGVHKT